MLIARLLIFLFAIATAGIAHADITCNQFWPAGSVIISARPSSTAPTHLYKVSGEGGSLVLIVQPSTISFSNPTSPYFSPAGQDGLLYFEADNLARHFIFALCGAAAGASSAAAT